MQFYNSIKSKIIFSVFFLISTNINIGCSKTSSTPFVLPDKLYTIKSVLDISNNNNASDIKITADPSTLLVTPDVQNVRLIITKTSKSITEKTAGALSAGKYYLFPVITTKNQTIKPDASTKDSDGDVIKSGDYYAYIFILGKANSAQLSDPKAFSLSDMPVLAGNFLGTWEDLGPPGPGTFPISMRINSDYTGALFYTDSYKPYGRGGAIDDAKMTFKITGNRFTCSINQFVGQYIGGGAFGTNGGCPNSKDLSGTILDDVNLVFDKFLWADCDGSREVIMKFTKQ